MDRYVLRSNAVPGAPTPRGQRRRASGGRVNAERWHECPQVSVVGAIALADLRSQPDGALTQMAAALRW